MLHGNVELHNVAEVHEVKGSSGLRMQRVPEQVRVKLNQVAQQRMLQPASGEIRFVSESGPARVTLSCPTGTAKAAVFYGVFQAAEVYTIGAEPLTLPLAVPAPLSKLGEDKRKQMPFSPSVCRVMMRGEPVLFHGAEGDGVRPPRPEEVPKVRHLAYGTSITHGAAATGPHLTYAAQTARRIGADLLNLGVGGSAHCEHELSDYIAEREDWHLATLALSVNMLGFTLEEFCERVSYMVNRVAGANVGRPVVCITLYPLFDDLGEQYRDGSDRAPAEAYRQKLRDAVLSCPHPNVRLVEGPDILTDIGGLTPDLIHPADNGMILMGENLARRLEPLVKDLG